MSADTVLVFLETDAPELTCLLANLFSQNFHLGKKRKKKKKRKELIIHSESTSHPSSWPGKASADLTRRRSLSSVLIIVNQSCSLNLFRPVILFDILVNLILLCLMFSVFIFTLHILYLWTKNGFWPFEPATQWKCHKCCHKAQNNKETFHSKVSVKLL